MESWATMRWPGQAAGFVFSQVGAEEPRATVDSREGMRPPSDAEPASILQLVDSFQISQNHRKPTGLLQLHP